MSALNPNQFTVHQGASPLEYDRHYSAQGPQRLTLRHPDAGTPNPNDRYIADTVRIERRGKNNRPLKKPREIPVPGAGENAAGFVDYEPYGDKGLRIHYMQTAEHLQRSGVGQQLIENLIKERNPSSIDFGKLMNEGSAKIMQRTSELHPNIQVSGSNYYNPLGNK